MHTAKVVVSSAADASVSLRGELAEASIAENPTARPGATNSLKAVKPARKRRAATEAEHHAASRELEAVAAEGRGAGAAPWAHRSGGYQLLE